MTGGGRGYSRTFELPVFWSSNERESLYHTYWWFIC